MTLRSWWWPLAILVWQCLLVRLDAKECMELSRGKELKKLVQSSHVLVALQGSNNSRNVLKEEEDDDEDDSDDEDDDEEVEEDENVDHAAVHQQLCKRLKETPDARVKDFNIVKVMDSNLKRKVLEDSKPAPTNMAMAKLLERWNIPIEQYLPAFLVSTILGVPASSLSSTAHTIPPTYPEYLLYKQGEYEKGPVRYMDSSKDADDIATFVSSQLGRQKIGNYVYSLGAFDIIASKFMESTMAATSSTTSASDDDSSTGINALTTRLYHAVAPMIPLFWVHVVARMTRFSITRPLMPSHDGFEQQLADMYWKTLLKVLERGTDYPMLQVERLERMLSQDEEEQQQQQQQQQSGGGSQSSSHSLNPLQREMMSQRLHILKKFSEPMTVPPEEFQNFAWRVGANLFSMVAVIVLIPMIFLVKDDEDDDDEEEEEEHDDQDDTHDEITDDDRKADYKSKED